MQNKFWHRYTSRWLQFLTNIESMEFHFIKVTQLRGESRLLFVHQTKFQRRLLDCCRNSICLLDTTYKTIKYSLLLLFDAVKTNVDYWVVCSLVLQDETRIALTEALAVIKKRSPNGI